MAARQKQQGLTLIGFVIVLLVIGAFAFVGLKLFPVYSEYYSVVSDMKGIAAEPGAIRQLSKAADGSLRDGLSLLDQAIAYALQDETDA